MARDLTKIIIIDLECTCWEEGGNPAGVQQEIIEFGICNLDLKTLEVEDLNSILVKPKFGSISPFCTELTSITTEMVDANGVSFAEALKIIGKLYKPKDQIWASYGDFDRHMIKRQLGYYDGIERIKNPLGRTHWNIKNLFAVACRLPKEVGMARALEVCGRDLEGHHHRGVDDVKNIAKIVVDLIQRMRS